jgi:hypothetical protein
MDIAKIYSNVSVEEFHVKRDGDSFTVSFGFLCNGSNVSAKIIGVRDPSELCEILNAQRLWIEKTEGHQLEFGSYTLGVSHEYYTEIVFDRLA